jgi:tetratricopeptide (TPR) repeat protein
VKIEIDARTIISQEVDYKKTVALCEKGKYSEAKIILKKLIEKNPTNSEYHRIMGQILSDEGDQEEAINCLIDALRWDPKNGWALLMTGNIFAKFKDDIPTAMKYYDQALLANPKDNITINNIGANLMQQGKLEEAKKYFWEAIKIDDQYPNTHFALRVIAEMENDLHSAFLAPFRQLS